MAIISLKLFNSDGSICSEKEQALLIKYPVLERLKAHTRLGINRYEHTLLLLKSFERLMNNDYSTFCRLASRIESEGFLTQSQFEQMHNLIKNLIVFKEDQLFFFLLLLTHDYGAIHGESRHFVRSGELCIQDFKDGGFGDTEIRIAKLLVGNHSYMGDLFLGEGNIDYGFFLYSELETLSATPDKYWSMLWLLTLIDINSAGDGYLSRYRFDALKQIKTINGLKELKNSWQKDRYKYLGKTADFYEKFKLLISPKVEHLYLQYFHNITEFLGDTELINILNNCCLFLEQRDNKKIHYFNFITFSGDKKENLNKLLNLCKPQPKIIILNTITGLINGIPFSITDDGYLELNVN